jgi:hypothetical protein
LYRYAEEGIKQLVPIPPTQETVNVLFGEAIDSEAGAEYKVAAFIQLRPTARKRLVSTLGTYQVRSPINHKPKP